MEMSIGVVCVLFFSSFKHMLIHKSGEEDTLTTTAATAAAAAKLCLCILNVVYMRRSHVNLV